MASRYSDISFNWDKIWDKMGSILKKNMEQKTQECVENGYMFFKKLKVTLTFHFLKEESVTIAVAFKPENEEIAQVIIPDLKIKMEILAKLFMQKYMDSEKIGFLSHQEFKLEIDNIFRSK